jgi:uncharacterized protein (DUF2062 family)
MHTMLPGQSAMRRDSSRRDMDQQHTADFVKPIVIAPTFNNAGTLVDVLSRISSLGLPIIVVNDGSGDDTAMLLQRWISSHPESQIIAHARNRGKAAALQTGFATAGKAGFTHAITIDTDGQHDPECIPRLLELSRQMPDAYVIGVRDVRQPGYPRKSRVGRRVSNLLIRLECGLRVADSQCGLRIYPLDMVRAVPCHANRYGYETEMITRAAWSGCRVIETSVKSHYLPIERRVSHFQPWRDSLRGAAMHIRLLLRAIAPIPHRRYRLAEVDRRPRMTVREMLNWLNPMRAWRELRGGELDRSEFAAALAAGVFVANLPLYPLQTAIALYVARRLHLNPLAVIAGSQISTPPIGFVLIVGGIYIGHLILHGTLPPLPDWHLHADFWRTLGRPLLFDWILGSVILGFVLAVLTFMLASQFYTGGEADEDAEVDSAPTGQIPPASKPAA